MEWNYLTILKLQRYSRWSLGMDKWYHPSHYCACDSSSMLGLKLIHVVKGLLVITEFIQLLLDWYTYILSKVNICNVNRARATAFIFNTRTDVCPSFWDRKCLDLRGTRTFGFMPNALTIWAIGARHLLSHVSSHTIATVPGKKHWKTVWMSANTETSSFWPNCHLPIFRNCP